MHQKAPNLTPNQESTLHVHHFPSDAHPPAHPTLGLINFLRGTSAFPAGGTDRKTNGENFAGLVLPLLLSLLFLTVLRKSSSLAVPVASSRSAAPALLAMIKTKHSRTTSSAGRHPLGFPLYLDQLSEVGCLGSRGVTLGPVLILDMFFYCPVPSCCVGVMWDWLRSRGGRHRQGDWVTLTMRIKEKPPAEKRGLGLQRVYFSVTLGLLERRIEFTVFSLEDFDPVSWRETAGGDAVH